MASTQFSQEFYYSQRPDVQAAIANGTFGGSAEDHYNQFGWRELSDPNTWFDTSYYLAANPDVRAARVNPFQHFVNHGSNEGRSGSAQSLFDEMFYFNQRPDVLLAIINGGWEGSAEDHYNWFGWQEGSAPNIHFDTSYYLANNTDVAEADINPFQHFVTFGIGEGRRSRSESAPNDGGDGNGNGGDGNGNGGDGNGNGGGTVQTVTVAQAKELPAGTPYNLADTLTNLANPANATLLENATTYSLIDTNGQLHLTVANATVLAGAANAGAYTYSINDTFSAVEAGNLSLLNGATNVNAWGTSANDVIDLSALTVSLGLNGNEGDDTITGGASSDWINGGPGNDTLVGGPSGNALIGGAGADTIVLWVGGNDVVEYIADTDAGTTDTVPAQTQGDTVTGFMSVAVPNSAAEFDKIRLDGSFLFESMTGTTSNGVAPVTYGAGIDLDNDSDEGDDAGTDSVFLIAAGANTATLDDLFTLPSLNAAIGALTNEAIGDERILAFNSSNGATENPVTNAVLYKFTSVAADNALTADELQVLGTFEGTNLDAGDFIFA